MRPFLGFPDGKLKVMPIPDLFFSDLLPQIDDLFELKVTLYCLWAFQHKEGPHKVLTWSELAGDQALLQNLQDARLDAVELLRESIERAVARGTLLQVSVRGQAGETLYLLNSEIGRATLEAIERGEWQPESIDASARLEPSRPNIFVLYEQNVGLLQPLLVDELKEAERTYPSAWIEDAFRIAVAQNVRRWSYIKGILERWAREGREGARGDESGRERRRYVGGEYADSIKH
ncbi:MAG: DnaD domain protein [Anaerolineae bacterium]|nr:DnaD domain protein [Anaerolineae bacterium]